MELNNRTMVFDDEYLIRVFVRIRREETIPTEKKNAMESALHHKIYQNSKYILPEVIQRDGKGTHDFLINIISAIYKSDRLFALATQEANREMHVRSKVVVPTTIVYIDTITGLPISYNEFEARYYKHLASKRALTQKYVRDSHENEDDSRMSLKRIRNL